MVIIYILCREFTRKSQSTYSNYIDDCIVSIFLWMRYATSGKCNSELYSIEQRVCVQRYTKGHIRKRVESNYITTAFSLLFIRANMITFDVNSSI